MKVIGTDKNGDEIAEVSVTELDTMFKEIRAKVIDEFAEQIKAELQGEHWTQFCTMRTMIDKIAEQLKAGGIE